MKKTIKKTVKKVVKKKKKIDYNPQIHTLEDVVNQLNEIL